MNKSLKIALRVGYGLLAAVIVVVSIAMVLRVVDIEGTLDYILGIGGDLEYELQDDGTYMVVGIGDCDDTEIYIPSEYNGRAVTAIGDYAFRNCSSITRIVVPDTVASIGSCAFYCCTSLTDITIPDTVTSIGSRAFYYCTSLTDITIPDSVTSIEEYAFYGCSVLTDITIPDSVEYVGSYAFSNCTWLTHINCEADSQPSGWEYKWAFASGAVINWGA